MGPKRARWPLSSRDDEHHDFLDTTEGVWFTSFDPKRHVSLEAEYDPVFYVRCAIDAGTSRHTAAVFFQVRHSPGSDRKRVTVFGDYHVLDVVSQKNARAIRRWPINCPAAAGSTWCASTRPRRRGRRWGRRPIPNTSASLARDSPRGGLSTWF